MCERARPVLMLRGVSELQVRVSTVAWKFDQCNGWSVVAAAVAAAAAVAVASALVASHAMLFALQRRVDERARAGLDSDGDHRGRGRQHCSQCVRAPTIRSRAAQYKSPNS